jgi:hypothetical protein
LEDALGVKALEEVVESWKLGFLFEICSWWALGVFLFIRRHQIFIIFFFIVVFFV